MKRAPRSRLPRLGGAGLALGAALIALGAGALAWSAGWLAPARALAPPPGTVGVPAAAIPIAAYERIELRHLVRPSGDLALVYLPEGSILPDTVTRPDDLIGRVLAGDKAAGLLFTKRDFLPPGTRPGFVAGIPPGMRALRVDATQVGGIAGLARGDRFDLVATAPPRGGSPQAGGEPRLRTRLLVEDGLVVEPLDVRQLSAPNGPRLVEEIVIAVGPDEVAALTEALARGARIDCVPRSGQPGGAEPALPARGGRSWDGQRTVERIRGSRRETLTVPESSAPAHGAAARLPLVSAAPAGLE